MVVSWLEGYFDSLHAAGYQSNELALTGIMVNLFSVRYVFVSLDEIYIVFS